MNINLTIKNAFIILRFVRYNTGWVGVVQDSVVFNVVMVCGECVFSLKVNFSFPLKWEKWEKFHSLFNYSFICFHFISFYFVYSFDLFNASKQTRLPISNSMLSYPSIDENTWLRKRNLPTNEQGQYRSS